MNTPVKKSADPKEGAGDSYLPFLMLANTPSLRRIHVLPDS